MLQQPLRLHPGHTPPAGHAGGTTYLTFDAVTYTRGPVHKPGQAGSRVAGVGVGGWEWGGEVALTPAVQ